MDTLTLQEGSIFAGRYRIVRRIAIGGMGDVYEVIHLETERRRALKVMQHHVLTSERMRERFRQEARINARVESEFIVDVFDAGVDDATELPFLVMELLRGEELKKTISRTGRLPIADVVTYLNQVALALEKTHKANIVHRDLKPDNLFLIQREDGSYRIKVLDFGIAKFLASDEAHPNTTHEVMGTPLYMAPEQFRTDTTVTAAVDIYSLGMIAYTLLVGCSYWKDEINAGVNVLVFAALALQGPKETATERARRQGVPLPSAFDRWFATATATSPEERFRTALIAVEELDRSLGVTLNKNTAAQKPPTMLRFTGTIPMDRYPHGVAPSPLAASFAAPPPPSSPHLASLSLPPPTSSGPSTTTDAEDAPPPSERSALEESSHSFSTTNTVPAARRPASRRRIPEALGLSMIAVTMGVVAFFVARAHMYAAPGQRPDRHIIEPASPAAAAPPMELSPVLREPPKDNTSVPSPDALSPVPSSDTEPVPSARPGATEPTNTKPPATSTSTKPQATTKPRKADLGLYRF